jgi:hypothetical protein
MQYVLRPLQSGAMPPAWRVRFPARPPRPHVWNGQGAGGGACNRQGPLEFNGAAITRITCIVKWFGPGSANVKLSWFCADGWWPCY